ncbi:MAG: M56 family metallopeptidase, partial [Candidatus Spyradocola sp.]
MKTLLMMSLTGSLMALVVMALRALFGKRLHPRVTYALWLAAALCLLLPLRFESEMSVMNAPAARSFERSVSVRMEQPVAYGFVSGNAAQNGQSDVHYMDAPTREELESGQVQPEQGFTLDAWDVAGMIWAAGALVTAGYIALVNARFRGRVRRSRRTAEVPWVMERRLGGVKVYVSRAVPSPCLVGLFRPYIVVTPQAMAEDERFCHVLVHELSHKRQGDPLWSAVRTAVLVLHWFNPIVWIAASLSRADCENACDALTIRELGEDRRVDYGKTLLSFLRARPTATGLVNTATTMAQSRRQIRRRISLIAKKQKYTLVAAVLCIALALTGCAVTMTTAPGEQPVQTPAAAEPTEAPAGNEMSDEQRAAFEQAKHAALLQGGDWQYAETDV